MELGMIGLGKMGGNVTRRLLHGGHRMVVYDQSAETIDAVVDEGAVPTESLEDLASRLSAPRAVWMMVPSGTPTGETIEQLIEVLGEDDTIIDGGNSNYNDTVRRTAMLEERGLHYVDVGTSGGVWGLKDGYSIMAGGEAAVVERLRPVFETLAPVPDRGWGARRPERCGPLREDGA